MAGGDVGDLGDALGGDVAATFGEGFEAALEGKGHAFEKAAVDDVGEGVPVEDAVDVGGEGEAAGDLSKAAEEDVAAVRGGGEVFGVAGVADDAVGWEGVEQEGGGGEGGGAEDEVGVGGRRRRDRVRW